MADIQKMAMEALVRELMKKVEAKDVMIKGLEEEVKKEKGRHAEEMNKGKGRHSEEMKKEKQEEEEDEAYHTRKAEIQKQVEESEPAEIAELIFEFEQQVKRLKAEKIARPADTQAPVEAGKTKPKKIYCGCCKMDKPKEEPNPNARQIFEEAGLCYATMRRCGNVAHQQVQFEGETYNVCKAHMSGKKGVEQGVKGEPKDGFYETAEGKVAPLKMYAHYKYTLSKRIIKAQIEAYPERYAYLGGANPKDTFKKWMENDPEDNDD